MQVKDSTVELAKYWAKTGVDILFDGADPFKGSVSREKLEDNLYNKIFIKILEQETFELTEEEFLLCVELSKLTYELQRH